MKRRDFVRGFIALGGCAACAKLATASEGAHWEYKGEHGPEHWGDVDKSYNVCSAGTQQSPISITSAIKAEVDPISVSWKKTSAKIVNNGHTIQVNMPEGSSISRNGKVYDLLQFHFHAPSEHLVDGMTHPMEVHFVHKNKKDGDLAVLGVFLMPEQHHDAFSMLAKNFPQNEGGEGKVEPFSPSDLLPPGLEYWTYEGSLTTPPCSEIVTWLVAREPLKVEQVSIQAFTSIYSSNARPVAPVNRRLVLMSQ
jgi:carbonic anhydrase